MKKSLAYAGLIINLALAFPIGYFVAEFTYDILYARAGLTSHWGPANPAADPDHPLLAIWHARDVAGYSVMVIWVLLSWPMRRVTANLLMLAGRVLKELHQSV